MKRAQPEDRFSGHGSFVCRYRELRKACDGVSTDPGNLARTLRDESYLLEVARLRIFWPGSARTASGSDVERTASIASSYALRFAGAMRANELRAFWEALAARFRRSLNCLARRVLRFNNLRPPQTAAYRVSRKPRTPRHFTQRHPVAEMHPPELGQHAHVDHSSFPRSFPERDSQSRGSVLRENYLPKWVNSGWTSTDSWGARAGQESTSYEKFFRF